MKEKPPNPYKNRGGFREGLRYIATTIFPSEKAVTRGIEAKNRWDEYVNLRVNRLEMNFINSPQLQKDLEGLLEKHGIDEHEKSFRWMNSLEDAVIVINFKDSESMRNILNSPELRPEELSIAHIGRGGKGLHGIIRFVAGEIDDTKVVVSYSNIIIGTEGLAWGNRSDGGYVLDNHGDNLERWGYAFKEKEWTSPFPDLYELKK